jgi:hypothetical protein
VGGTGGWILSHCRICLDLPCPVLEATPKNE